MGVFASVPARRGGRFLLSLDSLEELLHIKEAFEKRVLRLALGEHEQHEKEWQHQHSLSLDLEDDESIQDCSSTIDVHSTYSTAGTEGSPRHQGSSLGTGGSPLSGVLSPQQQQRQMRAAQLSSLQEKVHTHASSLPALFEKNNTKVISRGETSVCIFHGEVVSRVKGFVSQMAAVWAVSCDMGHVLL